MKAAMFPPCPAAALCALALLLSGCSADQRAAQISRAPPDSPRVFYTTNPGCTIDGVPGTRVDTEQILRATVISEECFATPATAAQ